MMLHSWVRFKAITSKNKQTKKRSENFKKYHDVKCLQIVSQKTVFSSSYNMLPNPSSINKLLVAVSQQGKSLQAGHARRVRGEGCRGSSPSNQEHGSAGFRASSTCCTLPSTCPVVVDFSIQRICRDDPRGRAPPLQRVRRLHTSLYLLRRCGFSLLRGALTCKKKRERQEVS